MKYLFQTLCLIFGFLLLSTNTFSSDLPKYQRYAPVKLTTENKKPVFYKTEMNRLQKIGKYEGALCYAFLLRKYGNRRQIKKAEKFLAEHFENNLGMIALSIDSLKKQTAVFTDELSAQGASQLYCHYKDMITLKQLADEQDTQYKVPVDYTNQAAKAEQVRDDYYKKTAQMYFEQVNTAKSSASSKDDYKPLARKLSRALVYESRQDISDLYKEVKTLATTTIGVGKVIDGGNSAVIISQIRETVNGKLSGGINDQSTPFVKLLANNAIAGADLIVEATAGSRNIENLHHTPSSKTVKKVDEKTGKVYTAEFISYKKEAKVTFQGVYALKNRATGGQIRGNTITGHYTWTGYWYDYKGQIEALSKRQKRDIKRKEPPYPSDTELISPGADDFSQKVGIEVLNYLRKTYN